MSKREMQTLRFEKKQAIKVAKELMYPASVATAIAMCGTVREIDRVMCNARLKTM